MFNVQKFTHSVAAGSGEDGVCAKMPTPNVPAGSHWPNRVPALVLLTVAAKPASFHWLCRTCSVSSRLLLPAVVLSSTVAFWPTLAQMPSGPLVQPSPFISESTLVRSRLYLLNWVVYQSLFTGVV